MKVSVIGGGGIRSMFLAKSLTQRSEELGIDEIVFMDSNAEKLRIDGGMARHVAKKINPKVGFSLTTDAAEAVKDADYVITTIRVGGDQKRINDENAALELGVLGQETTGAAGFSFAMRSIPVLDEYCKLIKKHAKPNVKVFNFTNPAGLVSQALRDMGYDFTFGICDAPSGLLRAFAKLYDADPDMVTGECYGLNHLSFFSGIKVGGREVMPELIENDRVYTDTEVCFFKKDLVRHFGQIPNEYLYYYFYREEAIRNIINSGTTRGTIIRDINTRMFEELSAMDVENDFEGCLKVYEKWYDKRESTYMQNETGVAAHKQAFKFDIMSKDAGGYAGVALKYIEMERSRKPAEMILCVPNGGAIPGLLDSDVVEVSCTITPEGCTPHKAADIKEVPMEFIRRVKLYERLGSEAIRTRNRSLAIDCLTVHPLVNSYSIAEKLVDKCLEINKDYIKGWL